MSRVHNTLIRALASDLVNLRLPDVARVLGTGGHTPIRTFRSLQRSELSVGGVVVVAKIEVDGRDGDEERADDVAEVSGDERSAEAIECFNAVSGVPDAPE